MDDRRHSRNKPAGASLSLLPRFHQTMLGTWAVVALLHAAVVAAIGNREPVRSLGIAAILAAGFTSLVAIFVIWGFIDRVLDRFVYWRFLDAMWQRVIASMIVTPMVVVPSALSLGLPFILGYDLGDLIRGAVVYLPWTALLIWALSPRRAGQLSVRS